jgi:hypothetical protein
MARIRAILGALFTAFQRDTKSLGSFASNNFFLMSLFFLRQAGGFVYLIVGLVMFFPLATDPMRRIPAVRLALWPLSSRERWVLRLASPWLNPLTWILAALAVWAASGKVTIALWASIAAVFVIAFAAPSLPLAPRNAGWRWIPNLPGPLNHLVRKNLRELFSTLDFYCALILSAAVLASRVAGRQFPPEGFLAITVLVVLALSSYAQSLFGLDGAGAFTRYQLLPVRGWQVLAAKDAAFLLAAFILTLPLAPLPGLAAALAAVAVGHAPSVNQRREQLRWRFSSGASFGNGLGQVVLMAGAGGLVQAHPLFLVPILAGYLGSTWWYGLAIERGRLDN